MLRALIFCFSLGSLIGVGIGAIITFNARLVKQLSPFLGLIQWFPVILIFAGSDLFLTEIMTAILCASYHYIQGRSILSLSTVDSYVYTARETLLRTLLVSLITQLWVSRWQWFTFTNLMELRPGFEVFAILILLIGFINWSFKATFDTTAATHAALTNYLIERHGWRAAYDFILLTVVSVLLCQLLGEFGVHLFKVAPNQLINPMYNLFSDGEIWRDIGLSLLEVVAGTLCGGLFAHGMFLVLKQPALRKFLSLLLPATYTSLIVVWLIIFATWITWFQTNGPSYSIFLYLWHKVIAVGCLSFFPRVESMWGVRDRPVFCRFLLASDAALPIAFVAMAFGETWAATQGLGFHMVVATATGQLDRAVGTGLITFALLVAISFMLRHTAQTLCQSAKIPEAHQVS